MKNRQPNIESYAYESPFEKDLGALKIAEQYIRHTQFLINELEEKIENLKKQRQNALKLTQDATKAAKKAATNLKSGTNMLGSTTIAPNGQYYFTTTGPSISVTPSGWGTYTESSYPKNINELNKQLNELNELVDKINASSLFSR